jgi:hypothetical protein
MLPPSLRVPAYVGALTATLPKTPSTTITKYYGKLIRDSQIIFETWLSGDFPVAFWPYPVLRSGVLPIAAKEPALPMGLLY